MTSGPWIAVIGATVLLQMFGTFLLRVPPTIAPMLMANAGLSEAAIGHFSALNTLASIMFLLIGAPLVRRFGSVRSLQLGAAVSAFGTLLFLAPNPIAIGAAMFLIGFGYGPAPSAGSDILQRYAPINHRSLVFSIKQAGAPLGGVLAGLVMPSAASAFGIWGALGPFWALPTAFLRGTAAAGGVALVNAVGNIGGFVGPTVVGYARDATGSFAAGLWVLAAALVVGAVAVLALPADTATATAASKR